VANCSRQEAPKGVAAVSLSKGQGAIKPVLGVARILTKSSEIVDLAWQ